MIPELIMLRHPVSNSSPPTMEEKEGRSPSPNIILRRDNDFLNSQKSAWDSSSDGEEEAEARKVPDVRRDDLASRRAPRGPAAPKVHQFVPQPVCSNKDRERWEGIRRASQQTLQEKENRLAVCVCEFAFFLPFSSNSLLNILSHFPALSFFGFCGHLWFDLLGSTLMCNMCWVTPLYWPCDWTVRREHPLKSLHAETTPS